MAMPSLPNMVSPSSSSPYNSSWDSALETASLAVILVFSVLGNALVSLTLVRRGLLAHPSNRLVLSLTASNLVFALLVLPGVLASTASGTSWPPLTQIDKEGNWSATWWCQFSAFAELFVSTASSATLAAIALDRYYAIVKPMKYTRTITPTRTLWMLSGIWLLALACASPPYMGWSRFAHHPGQHACVVAWDASLSFSVCFFAVAVISPLCLMCLCYYAILQVARTKCRRIHVGILADPTDAISYKTGGVDEEISLPTHDEPIAPSNYPWSCKGCRPAKEGEEEEGEVEDKEQQMGPRTCSLGRLSFSGPTNPKNSRVRSKTTRSNLLRRSISLELASQSAFVNSQRVTTCSLCKIDRFNLRPASYPSQVPAKNHDRLVPLPISMRSPDELVKPALNPVDKFTSSTCNNSQYRTLFRTDRTSGGDKKFSFSQRKASWGWASSTTPPIKGFSTVFLVITAFLMTWSPTVIVACWEIRGSFASNSSNMADNSNLIPSWLHVLAFWSLSAGTITYPLLYGVYNRSIRKQLFRAAWCAKGLKYEHNQRRASKWSNYSDYSVLRVKEKNSWTGSIHATIAGPIDLNYTQSTGSSSTPRKPSQDSGAVMMSADEDDTKEPRAWRKLLRKKSRRMSAPSILWNYHQLYLSDHQHHGMRVGHDFLGTEELCKSSPATRQGSMRRHVDHEDAAERAPQEGLADGPPVSAGDKTKAPNTTTWGLAFPRCVPQRAAASVKPEVKPSEVQHNSHYNWCLSSQSGMCSDEEEEENTLYYSQCQYTFTVELHRTESLPSLGGEVGKVLSFEQAQDDDLRKGENYRKLLLAVADSTPYLHNNQGHDSSRLSLSRIMSQHGGHFGKKTNLLFEHRQCEKRRSQSCGSVVAVTAQNTDLSSFKEADVRHWRKLAELQSSSCARSQRLHPSAPSCQMSVDEGIEKDCITQDVLT